MVKDRLAAARDAAGAHLVGIVPDFEDEQGELTAAVSYALEGGKGVRAALVMESCRVCGVPGSAAEAAAGAAEAFHAYSLIHDDLPAMDDDDMRRGRPTVHKAFGETLAILAGDALQAIAFESLSRIDTVPPARVLAALRELGHVGGVDGMVGGQWLDLCAERGLLKSAEDDDHLIRRITYIQQRKTGALIRWCCEVGAVLGDAPRAPFRAYADAIGLAFQVRDDLLDVEGDAAEMGKAVGKDSDRGKATFVELLGVDGARTRAESLVGDALAALEEFGEEANLLRDIARFIVTRRS